MDSELISLSEAAKTLSVSIETLLKWNEFNILKPTITPTGNVGYYRHQLEQFIIIQNQLNKQEPDTPVIEPTPVVITSVIPYSKGYSLTPAVALVVSFLVTISLSQFVMSKLIDGESVSSAGLMADAGVKTTLTTPTPPFVPMLAESEINTGLMAGLEADNLAYGQIAQLSADNEVFDPIMNDESINSNQVGNDVLAVNVLGNGLVQSSNQIKQTSDLNLLLVLLPLLLVAFPFVLRKPQMSTLAGQDRNTVADKVIEINQKADGAIVLSFQGQEIKVCKPELDSESDQFIDRLLGMSSPEVKELDYDASKDHDIMFDAPLSKLVTRLGFVGVKRDLFFPRTSKSRVLFRRYLTSADLSAMNMTVETLSGLLTSGN